MLPTKYIAWSVVRSDTVVGSAETAEPIEMPFGLRTRVDPRSHVLDGVQISHGKGHFWGKERPIVKYREALPYVSRAKRQN